MIIKRSFDFLLSFFGLIISAPLWIVFALLIWIEDRGPVFYCQERVGKDGVIFKEYKFRSMKYTSQKEEVFSQAQAEDLRITNVGRMMRYTAMDELPQLVNILKGDMSFVGPRALVASEKEVGQKEAVSVFDIPGFKERSKVRPGLTGIAQIFAPRDIDRGRKFQYDIWYIKNRNFFLDLYLIGISFLITFRGKWELREDKFFSIGRQLREKVNRDLGIV